MSRPLISHNADLSRLRDEGYNLDIDSGILIVRDIPYVNEKREVRRGVLAAALNLNGDILNPPGTHTIKFAGEYPCDSQGRPIEAIRASSGVFKLTERLTAQHQFSAKPPRTFYESYHEQITTYAEILGGPAANIEPFATARTKQVVEPTDDQSPFHYVDTASARAEINIVTKKLAVEKVAIVGVGGTGSYILDLLAKTPVREIHLFDSDTFSSHNAFRCPGAASKDDLHKHPLKVEYLAAIYSRMHKGIVPHDYDIDAGNVQELHDMSCVFLCVDGGSGKQGIVEGLERLNRWFIDVGMGLYEKNDMLGGLLRVTMSTPQNRAVAKREMSAGGGDKDDEYDRNIQVADLNSLNATLAVIRWKKVRGFYFDHERERGCVYTVGSNMICNEDLNESP